MLEIPKMILNEKEEGVSGIDGRPVADAGRVTILDDVDGNKLFLFKKHKTLQTTRGTRGYCIASENTVSLVFTRVDDWMCTNQYPWMA